MLSFTSDQRRALLFTIIIIIAAVIIQWVQPHIRVSESLDYSESDSIFYRLSKQTTYKYIEQNAQDVTNTQKSVQQRHPFDSTIDTINLIGFTFGIKYLSTIYDIIYSKFCNSGLIIE